MFSSSLSQSTLHELAFFCAVGAISLIFIWIVFLELRLRKFLSGDKPRNLEEILSELRTSSENYHAFRSELEAYLKLVEKRLRRSIQGTGTVRFNPYAGSGSGGNQSFATAFINENGDGVVFSTLYSRDHVSIFGKPLKEYTSTFDLTTEEKNAIEEARTRIV